MGQRIKQLTDFLIGIGVEQVSHTGKSYLAHLIGVYRDLETWGCGPDVCGAGMFHSIYGTELFQGFKLPFAEMSRVGFETKVWGQIRGGKRSRKPYELQVLHKSTWVAISGQARPRAN